MTSISPETYLATLQVWRGWATDQGYPTPEPPRLVEISRIPQQWADGPLSPLETAYRETIDHLLAQTTLGVTPEIAVAHMPEHLRAAPDVPDPEPAPRRDDPPAAATATDDPQARILRALIEWRTAQIANGVEGADSIKDVTLRNLLRRNQTSVNQIRRKLTGAAAALAPEIATVIAAFADEAADEPETVTPEPRRTPRPPVTPAASQPTPAPTPTTAPSSPAASGAPAADTTTADTTGQAGSATGTGTGRTWSHGDFCEYDYPETDVEPGRIKVGTAGDGVQLSWESWPTEGRETVLYRVVSGDDVAPYKPESGELIGVTATAALDDGRFLASAVRVFQVWCHVGVDESSARAAQPVKWAEGEEVSPVEGMRLSEESGRVIGEWSVHTGTRSVRVYRIPLEGSGPPVANPSNQICSDQPNLTGFVDSGATRGRRFLYAVQAEVMVDDSARLSRQVKKDILVTVDLDPVTDLTVTMSESGGTFDLRWSTPESGQQVQIHRFASAPPAGLENEDRDASAITVQGFTEESRIKDPVTALDPTTSQMTGVLWPPDWERAYLTPVTLANGRVRIGTTQVQTRPLPAVIKPRIIERFNTELITFGWPAGAAAVQVFVGPTTLSPEQICSQSRPSAEVTASTHRRDGAIIMPQPLSSNGCTVCLAPVAYSRGEQIRGEIATLAYPGLTRMEYRFEPVPTDNPRSRVLRLWVGSESELANPPALVLVANRERLPLDLRDGHNLQFLVRGQRTPHCQLPHIQPGVHRTDFYVDLGNEFAFVRVFVDDTADRTPRVALTDPPMQQLWQFRAPTPQGDQR
ncbi:hypothetical protein [Gordonia sp. NB41Y]|uniref:hypothetical protein n=1 Tax=Gordonia sp. NB41Y TaxID=875808 RepID=UPI00273BB3F6|nr:hypothetical protein [Gordonia sp. NB41Y]WLP88619.1 hypothetical protein Q9K23_13385 [Gordonia sp. NB41Y]